MIDFNTEDGFNNNVTGAGFFSVSIVEPQQLVDVTPENGAVNPPMSASFKLSCFDMTLQYAKATKRTFDPFSTVLGSVTGCACCCLMLLAQAEENSKPATRGDVKRGRANLQRQDAAEQGCAFLLGYIAGDIITDIASALLGACVGAPTAAVNTCIGNNAGDKDVWCYTSAEIQEVNLTDSCDPIRDCFASCSA